MVPEIRPFFHGRRSGLSFFRKFFICSLALAFIAFIISEMNAYALFTTHMETCRNMTAACEYQIDGTCDATTYDDWRLPTAEELALFVGIDTEATSYLYTRTPSYSTEGEYVVMKISDGDWFSFPAVIGSYANARCVR